MIGYDFARYWKGITLLLLMFLFVAAGAWGQDRGTAPAASSPSGTAFTGLLPTVWQFSIGYQYNRIDLRGAVPPFNTNGFNFSIVRYFGRFWGVEGDEGDGFGSAVRGATFKSLFVGAGLHVAYHNHSRFEPWAHALLGASHFNFGNAPPLLPVSDTAIGWIAGGGLDYHFHSRYAVRMEGDYFGSHFGGAYQRNTQIAGGFVWNF